MKKAKLMLMSIAVLAIVAGALAFKAKTYNLLKYCTSVATYSTCPNPITVIKPADGSVVTPKFTAYYTTTNSALNCASNLPCSSTVSISFTDDDE